MASSHPNGVSLYNDSSVQKESSSCPPLQAGSPDIDSSVQKEFDESLSKKLLRNYLAENEIFSSLDAITKEVVIEGSQITGDFQQG